MKGMKIVSKIKLLFLVLFLSVAPLVLNAQTHYDETESDGGVVTDTPVDGGVVLLLVAGVGFGAIKIYRIVVQSKLKKSI